MDEEIDYDGQDCAALNALHKALNLDKAEDDDHEGLSTIQFGANAEGGYGVQIDACGISCETLEEAMREMIAYAKERRTI